MATEANIPEEESASKTILEEGHSIENRGSMELSTIDKPTEYVCKPEYCQVDEIENQSFRKISEDERQHQTVVQSKDVETGGDKVGAIDDIDIEESDHHAKKDSAKISRQAGAEELMTDQYESSKVVRESSQKEVITSQTTENTRSKGEEDADLECNKQPTSISETNLGRTNEASLPNLDLTTKSQGEEDERVEESCTKDEDRDLTIHVEDEVKETSLDGVQKKKEDMPSLLECECRDPESNGSSYKLEHGNNTENAAMVNVEESTFEAASKIGDNVDDKLENPNSDQVIEGVSTQVEIEERETLQVVSSTACGDKSKDIYEDSRINVEKHEEEKRDSQQKKEQEDRLGEQDILNLEETEIAASRENAEKRVEQNILPVEEFEEKVGKDEPISTPDNGETSISTEKIPPLAESILKIRGQETMFEEKITNDLNENTRSKGVEDADPECTQEATSISETNLGLTNEASPPNLDLTTNNQGEADERVEEESCIKDEGRDPTIHVEDEVKEISLDGVQKKKEYMPSLLKGERKDPESMGSSHKSEHENNIEEDASIVNVEESMSEAASKIGDNIDDKLGYPYSVPVTEGASTQIAIEAGESLQEVSLTICGDKSKDVYEDSRINVEKHDEEKRDSQQKNEQEVQLGERVILIPEETEIAASRENAEKRNEQNKLPVEEFEERVEKDEPTSTPDSGETSISTEKIPPLAKLITKIKGQETIFPEKIANYLTENARPKGEEDADMECNKQPTSISETNLGLTNEASLPNLDSTTKNQGEEDDREEESCTKDEDRDPSIHVEDDVKDISLDGVQRKKEDMPSSLEGDCKDPESMGSSHKSEYGNNTEEDASTVNVEEYMSETAPKIGDNVDDKLEHPYSDPVTEGASTQVAIEAGESLQEVSLTVCGDKSKDIYEDSRINMEKHDEEKRDSRSKNEQEVQLGEQVILIPKKTEIAASRENAEKRNEQNKLPVVEFEESVEIDEPTSTPDSRETSVSTEKIPQLAESITKIKGRETMFPEKIENDLTENTRPKGEEDDDMECGEQPTSTSETNLGLTNEALLPNLDLKSKSQGEDDDREEESCTKDEDRESTIHVEDDVKEISLDGVQRKKEDMPSSLEGECKDPESMGSSHKLEHGNKEEDASTVNVEESMFEAAPKIGDNVDDKLENPYSDPVTEEASTQVATEAGESLQEVSLTVCGDKSKDIYEDSRINLEKHNEEKRDSQQKNEQEAQLGEQVILIPEETEIATSRENAEERVEQNMLPVEEFEERVEKDEPTSTPDSGETSISTVKIPPLAESMTKIKGQETMFPEKIANDLNENTRSKGEDADLECSEQPTSTSETNLGLNNEASLPNLDLKSKSQDEEDDRDEESCTKEEDRDPNIHAEDDVEEINLDGVQRKKEDMPSSLEGDCKNPESMGSSHKLEHGNNTEEDASTVNVTFEAASQIGDNVHDKLENPYFDLVTDEASTEVAIEARESLQEDMYEDIRINLEKHDEEKRDSHRENETADQLGEQGMLIPEESKIAPSTENVEKRAEQNILPVEAFEEKGDKDEPNSPPVSGETSISTEKIPPRVESITKIRGEETMFPEKIANDLNSKDPLVETEQPDSGETSEVPKTEAQEKHQESGRFCDENNEENEHLSETHSTENLVVKHMDSEAMVMTETVNNLAKDAEELQKIPDSPSEDKIDIKGDEKIITEETKEGEEAIDKQLLATESVTEDEDPSRLPTTASVRDEIIEQSSHEESLKEGESTLIEKNESHGPENDAEENIKAAEQNTGLEEGYSTATQLYSNPNECSSAESKSSAESSYSDKSQIQKICDSEHQILTKSENKIQGQKGVQNEDLQTSGDTAEAIKDTITEEPHGGIEDDHTKISMLTSTEEPSPKVHEEETSMDKYLDQHLELIRDQHASFEVIPASTEKEIIISETNENTSSKKDEDADLECNEEAKSISEKSSIKNEDMDTTMHIEDEFQETILTGVQNEKAGQVLEVEWKDPASIRSSDKLDHEKNEECKLMTGGTEDASTADVAPSPYIHSVEESTFEATSNNEDNDNEKLENPSSSLAADGENTQVAIEAGETMQEVSYAACQDNNQDICESVRREIYVPPVDGMAKAEDLACQNRDVRGEHEEDIIQTGLKETDEDSKINPEKHDGEKRDLWHENEQKHKAEEQAHLIPENTEIEASRENAEKRVEQNIHPAENFDIKEGPATATNTRETSISTEKSLSLVESSTEINSEVSKTDAPEEHQESSKFCAENNKQDEHHPETQNTENLIMRHVDPMVTTETVSESTKDIEEIEKVPLSYSDQKKDTEEDGKIIPEEPKEMEGATDKQLHETAKESVSKYQAPSRLVTTALITDETTEQSIKEESLNDSESTLIKTNEYHRAENDAEEKIKAVEVKKESDLPKATGRKDIYEQQIVEGSVEGTMDEFQDNEKETEDASREIKGESYDPGLPPEFNQNTELEERYLTTAQLESNPNKCSASEFESSVESSSLEKSVTEKIFEPEHFQADKVEAINDINIEEPDHDKEYDGAKVSMLASTEKPNLKVHEEETSIDNSYLNQHHEVFTDQHASSEVIPEIEKEMITSQTNENTISKSEEDADLECNEQVTSICEITLGKINEASLPNLASETKSKDEEDESVIESSTKDEGIETTKHIEDEFKDLSLTGIQNKKAEMVLVPEGEQKDPEAIGSSNKLEHENNKERDASKINVAPIHSAEESTFEASSKNGDNDEDKSENLPSNLVTDEAGTQVAIEAVETPQEASYTACKDKGKDICESVWQEEDVPPANRMAEVEDSAYLDKDERGANEEDINQAGLTVTETTEDSRINPETDDREKRDYLQKNDEEYEVGEQAVLIPEKKETEAPRENAEKIVEQNIHSVEKFEEQEEKDEPTSTPDSRETLISTEKSLLLAESTTKVKIEETMFPQKVANDLDTKDPFVEDSGKLDIGEIGKESQTEGQEKFEDLSKLSTENDKQDENSEAQSTENLVIKHIDSEAKDTKELDGVPESHSQEKIDIKSDEKTIPEEPKETEEATDKQLNEIAKESVSEDEALSRLPRTESVGDEKIEQSFQEEGPKDGATIIDKNENYIPENDAEKDEKAVEAFDPSEAMGIQDQDGYAYSMDVAEDKAQASRQNFERTICTEGEETAARHETFSQKAKMEEEPKDIDDGKENMASYQEVCEPSETEVSALKQEIENTVGMLSSATVEMNTRKEYLEKDESDGTKIKEEVKITELKDQIEATSLIERKISNPSDDFSKSREHHDVLTIEENNTLIKGPSSISGEPKKDSSSTNDSETEFVRLVNENTAVKEVNPVDEDHLEGPDAAHEMMDLTISETKSNCLGSDIVERKEEETNSEENRDMEAKEVVNQGAQICHDIRDKDLITGINHEKELTITDDRLVHTVIDSSMVTSYGEPKTLEMSKMTENTPAREDILYVETKTPLITHTEGASMLVYSDNEKGKEKEYPNEGNQKHKDGDQPMPPSLKTVNVISESDTGDIVKEKREQADGLAGQNEAHKLEIVEDEKSTTEVTKTPLQEEELTEKTEDSSAVTTGEQEAAELKTASSSCPEEDLNTKNSGLLMEKGDSVAEDQSEEILLHSSNNQTEGKDNNLQDQDSPSVQEVIRLKFEDDKESNLKARCNYEDLLNSSLDQDGDINAIKFTQEVYQRLGTADNNENIREHPTEGRITSAGEETENEVEVPTSKPTEQIESTKSTEGKKSVTLEDQTEQTMEITDFSALKSTDESETNTEDSSFTSKVYEKETEAGFIKKDDSTDDSKNVPVRVDIEGGGLKNARTGNIEHDKGSIIFSEREGETAITTDKTTSDSIDIVGREEKNFNSQKEEILEELNEGHLKMDSCIEETDKTTIVQQVREPTISTIQMSPDYPSPLVEEKDAIGDATIHPTDEKPTREEIADETAETDLVHSTENTLPEKEHEVVKPGDVSDLESVKITKEYSYEGSSQLKNEVNEEKLLAETSKCTTTSTHEDSQTMQGQDNVDTTFEGSLTNVATEKAETASANEPTDELPPRKSVEAADTNEKVELASESKAGDQSDQKTNQVKEKSNSEDNVFENVPAATEQSNGRVILERSPEPTSNLKESDTLSAGYEAVNEATATKSGLIEQCEKMDLVEERESRISENLAKANEDFSFLSTIEASEEGLDKEECEKTLFEKSSMGSQGVKKDDKAEILNKEDDTNTSETLPCMPERKDVTNIVKVKISLDTIETDNKQEESSSLEDNRDKQSQDIVDEVGREMGQDTRDKAPTTGDEQSAREDLIKSTSTTFQTVSNENQHEVESEATEKGECENINENLPDDKEGKNVMEAATNLTHENRDVGPKITGIKPEAMAQGEKDQELKADRSEKGHIVTAEGSEYAREIRKQEASSLGAVDKKFTVKADTETRETNDDNVQGLQNPDGETMPEVRPENAKSINTRVEGTQVEEENNSSSTGQSLQADIHLDEATDSAAKAQKTETPRCEEAKADSGKDEGVDENQTAEPLLSGTSVTVETAKEREAKAAHKKSHNILSGVGSKVKHSISKVKKAITGKSSHPKTPSPK